METVVVLVVSTRSKMVVVVLVATATACSARSIWSAGTDGWDHHRDYDSVLLGYYVAC